MQTNDSGGEKPVFAPTKPTAREGLRYEGIARDSMSLKVVHDEEDQSVMVVLNVHLARFHDVHNAVRIIESHARAFRNDIDRLIPALPEDFYEVNLPLNFGWNGEVDLEPAGG